MTILFLILIILSSIILGFIVLVQNPKGGGMAGSLAGVSNQFMGVKQTTDVLEKGTWVFASIIGLLCIFSAFFITGTSSAASTIQADKAKSAPIPGSSNAAPVTPNNTFTLPNDSTKP